MHKVASPSTWSCISLTWIPYSQTAFSLKVSFWSIFYLECFLSRLQSTTIWLYIGYVIVPFPYRMKNTSNGAKPTYFLCFHINHCLCLQSWLFGHPSAKLLMTIIISVWNYKIIWSLMRFFFFNNFKILIIIFIEIVRDGDKFTERVQEINAMLYFSVHVYS